MALNASEVQGSGNNGSKQEPLEAGNYPARLVQVIDLGLQNQRPFQGQEKPPVNEIMLTYEFVDEFVKDEDGNDVEDKPRWLSETIPLHNISQDRAKSTMRYKALDPNMEFGGDFSKLLETPCNVTVVQNPGKGQHAGKVFTNIAGISTMRPRDAQKCPNLVNPPKVFDLDTPDMEVFGSLPDWVQDKIKSNLNFNGSELQNLLGNAPEEPKEEKKKADKKEEPQDPVDGDDTPW